MRRAKYIVYFIVAILVAGHAAAGKKDRYNPFRPDGTLRPAIILIEWDNIDIESDNREKMKKNNLITITAKDGAIKISKGKRTTELTAGEYTDLWKLFKKVGLFDLDANALTDPRPIGVPQRIFSIKIEGQPKKFFNVDIPNKKSRKHFKVIDAIDELCKKHLLI